MQKENFISWLRLTRGQAKLTDARFLVHENYEIKRMRDLGKSVGFNPTGPSSGANIKNYEKTRNAYYKIAHQEALQFEYRWLQGKIKEITNIKMSVPKIAVGDCERLSVNVPSRTMKSAMMSSALTDPILTISPSARLRLSSGTPAYLVRGNSVLSVHAVHGPNTPKRKKPQKAAPRPSRPKHKTNK